MVVEWFSDGRHEPFTIEAGPAGALLIHGFMGTPAEMRPLGRALAESGISSHGVLLPGFGAQLPKLGETRRADWVQAALDAWDSLVARHERTVLLGFSMGAAVALQVAARRQPDRVILLAPLRRLADRRVALLPVLKHVKRTVRPFKKADLSDPGLRQFLDEATPATDLDDPEGQRRPPAEFELSTFVLDELRRLAGDCDWLAERVTAPTLIIQGVNDPTVRHRDTRDLIAWFAGRVVLHELDADHQLVRDDRPGWPEVRELVVRFAAGAAE